MLGKCPVVSDSLAKRGSLDPEISPGQGGVFWLSVQVMCCSVLSHSSAFSLYYSVNSGWIQLQRSQLWPSNWLRMNVVDIYTTPGYMCTHTHTQCFRKFMGNGIKFEF